MTHALNTLRSFAASSPLPRLEQQMLWQRVLGVPRSWLIAHDTDPLPQQCVAQYFELQARRVAGEPMAYILGAREFMGHMFRVTPDVLIPRPDTETLVLAVLDDVREQPAPRILDLGTGSGAIALSIALARPDARVMATDRSEAALSVARDNAQALGATTVRFLQGNWYEALGAECANGQVPATVQFDVIVSNPPYIHRDDPHLDQGDVRFEPVMALTDGGDGLSDLQRIISGAAPWLARGGALYVEHGWDQAVAVRKLFEAQGFLKVRSVRDLAGIERVTTGCLPGLVL